MELKENDIIQSARLYVFMDGKLRWITTGEIFNKMGLDWKKKRVYLGDEEIAANRGKDITEWPEQESERPQRKMSILWMGDDKWPDYGGTHVVGFLERVKPDWYTHSKVKLIMFLKTNDIDRITTEVAKWKDHPNYGGIWLESGHEPDITGTMFALLAIRKAIEKYGTLGQRDQLKAAIRNQMKRMALMSSSQVQNVYQRHREMRIAQHKAIREVDSDAWNHPHVIFYDMTSCEGWDYPGWEKAFPMPEEGIDCDVFVIDCYANNDDGTVDYRGMAAGKRLVDIGLARSEGQFIPNLGACYHPTEGKPASLVDQWNWWKKELPDISAVAFWNSGLGCEYTGIYQNEYLAEQARKVNRMFGLI